MITSVKEVRSSKVGHGPNGLTYYNYFICRCVGGIRPRYHLFRVNNVLEGFEVLGNELPLQDCRRIVSEHEPHGTTVTQQNVDRFAKRNP